MRKAKSDLERCHRREPFPNRAGRRESEISQLIKEQCLSQKQWKKASDLEKDDLKEVWNQIKVRLTHLRRVERIRGRRSRREKARTSFTWDPFKYAQGLLEEKKNGTLQISELKLEEHIKSQLSDNQKEIPLGTPGNVLRPREPSTQFDTTPPKWSEVKQVVQRARAA